MKAIVYLPHCWIQTMDPAPRRIIVRITTTLFATLFAVFVVAIQQASADISRFRFLEDGDGIIEYVYDDYLNLKEMVFYDDNWNILHVDFGNPNPEDSSSGMKGDYDSAVALLKQNSGLKGIVGGFEYDMADTPIGRHQTGRGNGKIPAHNPNPDDSDGASTPPLPLGPPDFDPGSGSVGGQSGWFNPNSGSPAGQLKKHGKKRGDQGGGDDGGSDPTGGESIFGDLPGPPELVNPNPVSSTAAVKGSAERHVQIPIILGLGSNKAFGIGDTIALQVINAKEGLKGQVERYNGRRWVPFKQAAVRSRGKSGQSVKWEIKIKKQGKYRLRVGDNFSKKFAVKKNTVKMAPAKPLVRLKKNTITVGDKITINTMRSPDCTLICELQIKRGNNYKTVKKSEKTIFTAYKNGEYRVVASCKEGGPHSELFFDVLPKLRQQKVTKKKTEKTPAVQKQAKQRKMHQVAQKL